MHAYESALKEPSVSALAAQLADRFKYIIIDAPSSSVTVLKALISSSDSVLIPVETRNLSIKSLPIILNMIQNLRMLTKKDIKLEGILLTKMDCTSPAEREIRDKITASLPKDSVFKTIIAFDRQMEQASIDSIPVSLVNERKIPIGTYKDLAGEILSRHNHTGGDL
jgi:cellulose biosynthesis protein BcsQ